MKIRIQLVVYAACMVISGCASTPAELVEKSKTTENFCYPESENVIEERVRRFLLRCFESYSYTGSVYTSGVSVPVQSGVNYELVEERIPSGIRLSIKNDLSYGISAEITGASEPCNSEAKYYALTEGWRDFLLEINEAANDREAECKHIWNK